jgi:hypothetical protein
MNTKKCHLCRKTVTHVLPSIESESEKVKQLSNIFSSNKDLVQIINHVIKKQNDSINISHLIKQIGIFCEGYISVDEAESILQYLQDNGKIHYTVRNMIVRLCNQPWLIDLKLGSHGLCYFGNFGELPTLTHALQILQYNHGKPDDFNGL